MNLSLFVLPHVAAGVIALLLFWTAAFNKKGTSFHRKVGQAYLVSMAIIVLTGIPLTLKAYLTGYVTSAIFLGYLLILVSHSCFTSVRAIRLRQDRVKFLGPFHQVATGILGTAGAAVMIYGWGSNMAVILIPFGAIGVMSLIGLVRDMRKAEYATNWWLKEHYGAMIGNGIATHIAFSQIGLARILPGQSGTVTMLGWLVPLAVGMTAIVVLNRRYRKVSPRTPPVKIDSSVKTATAQTQ